MSINSFKFVGMEGQLDDVSTQVPPEDGLGLLRITSQRAAHVNLRDISGAELGNSANPVRLTTKIPLTASSPTFATVGTASAQAVAVNANRKGLMLVNTSSSRISLAFSGQTAVLDRGSTLYPTGVFWMDEYSFTTGQVNAIASAAGSNLTVQEFT